MRKALFALAIIGIMFSWSFAQIPQLDAAKTNTEPGAYNDVTGSNSQWIYIHVTLAGVIFEISNQDWVVGDNAYADAADDYYAFLQNLYHNAAGSHRGAIPGNNVPNTGAGYLGSFSATTDVPLLWNKGGVSLDFLLAVSNMAGWGYESKHSSNRPASPSANVASGNSFQNSMQVRAIFFKETGVMTNYGDSPYNNFKFPLLNQLPGVDFPAAPAPANASTLPSLKNADVVFTTSMGGAAALADFSGSTQSWQTYTGDCSWYEATSYRFNPETADWANAVPTITPKGLGVEPDQKVKIAMQLLTPRSVTRTYANAGYLAAPRMLKLHVWGVPSDATE